MIGNGAFVRTGLRQKTRQAFIDKPFLVLGVTVPMNNFVTEALTTPADTVTDTRRTHPDTRGFNGLGLHVSWVRSRHSAQV